MSKHGVLEFFGWRLLFSMREIAAALKEVAADTSVRAILLDVDSPGGTVDGIEELALAGTHGRGGQATLRLGSTGSWHRRRTGWPPGHAG